MDSKIKCMRALSSALEEAVKMSKDTDSPAQLKTNLDSISLLVSRGFNQLEIMMKNEAEQRQHKQTQAKFKRESAKMDKVEFI